MRVVPENNGIHLASDATWFRRSIAILSWVIGVHLSSLLLSSPLSSSMVWALETPRAENHQPSEFQAGVSAVDISPTQPTSIIAGGFLEGQATQVNDPLFVRCFVLDDGQTQIAFAIVDTCMMSQSLIDEAKTLASQQCGIPVDRMMVSATHTHSAPAAMGCLGTRQDQAYAATLPGKIAQGITVAFQNRRPARIGWSSIDDWEHTHNRRWIRKPEAKVVDPFGMATGLAHMHPGYQSSEVIGPSGPVDPALSIISLQQLDGKPMGVLANYSQHYFGAGPVSADYYWLFCKHVARILGQEGDGNGPFVSAMSQGTSGDLMWMDYGIPAKALSMDRYAEAVARYAEKALSQIEYVDHAPLAMVEKKIQLRYRTPDEARLAWARPIAAKIENDLPKSIPEVYAMESLILHERQQTELKLQAISIGELTIATLPNEVYALTGLKLRGRSPSLHHFNIELANGAEGYIPTPEQHVLGGYTTWPARTAGLEVEAEPKIVEALVTAMEESTGRPRRKMIDEHGPYAQHVIQLQPKGYWRLNDEDGNLARNAIAGGPAAKVSPGFAWYLPGVGSGTGIGEHEALTASSFSGKNQINRSIHIAGGAIEVPIELPMPSHSMAFWFWLGERSGASDRSGALYSGIDAERLVAHQDSNHVVHLEMNGVRTTQGWPADQWHLVVVVADGKHRRVYLDGVEEPVLVVNLPTDSTSSGPLKFGQGLQGKLDEIAVFPRSLTPMETMSIWSASNRGDSSSASKIQPVSPKDSLGLIHVPKGYRVELVASEPMIVDPVAFDWDHSGKLWVVEMSDYPLGMDGQGKAGGRVRVLTDRDRDGYYDESQLFANELNFPNGILTWRDGVLVTAAPEIWFLRDTDHDGRMDVKESLFRGFHEGNQQLRLNGLRWGIDGWVYCANGGHHAGHGLGTKVLSTRNGREYEIGSRDFRFHPDTGELEVESGPSQFGRNRNAWGDWFGTQNANPLWHYVIPDRYLSRNPYVGTMAPIKHVVGPNSPEVFPASQLEKRFHSFEQSGRFTSACSGMIYNDDLLFGRTTQSHAFTCEPFHNLVQHNVLTEQDTSFISERAAYEGPFDFFASEDRWCRPVMARTGPDGGLWIADMYRYMIEHPEWLPQEGKDELLPHYRLGDDRGRIYRIVPEKPPEPTLHTPGPSIWKWDWSDPATLLQMLNSSNDCLRDKAHQAMLWQSDPQLRARLRPLLGPNTIPEVRVQVMNLLDQFDELGEGDLQSLFRDRHPRIRQNAIRLAEGKHLSWLQNDLESFVQDRDPNANLQLVLSAGSIDDPRAGQAIAEIAARSKDDPFLRTAVIHAMPKHASSLILAMNGPLRDQLAEYRVPLLQYAIGSDQKQLVQQLVREAIDQSSERDATSLAQTLQAMQMAGIEQQKMEQQLGDPWRDIERDIELRMNSMLARFRDDSNQPNERLSAARLLVHSREHRTDVVEQLRRWLSPQTDPSLQRQAVEVMRQSGAANVAKCFIGEWPKISPELRILVMEALLSRSNWTSDLVASMEDGSLPLSVIDVVQRASLSQYPDPSIVERVKRLMENHGNPPRQELYKKFAASLSLEGDMGRGRIVFQRACSNCHRRGESGYEVGPNLATVVEHSAEKLLRNILDPTADIQPGYLSYTCVLDDGEILTGLLSGETASSLTIKQANGVLRVIARREISSLKSNGVSFMPEGLEANISVEEMADLIAFLKTPNPK